MAEDINAVASKYKNIGSYGGAPGAAGDDGDKKEKGAFENF